MRGIGAVVWFKMLWSGEGILIGFWEVEVGWLVDRLGWEGGGGGDEGTGRERL